jgi:hypothetical protein
MSKDLLEALLAFRPPLDPSGIWPDGTRVLRPTQSRWMVGLSVVTVQTVFLLRRTHLRQIQIAQLQAHRRRDTIRVYCLNEALRGSTHCD